MTDIAQLLGKDADNLLQHRCMTIPSDQLYLPGHDYVDRVMIDNNRPPAVLRNMQTLYNTGREQMNEQTQAMCFMAGANSIFYGCKLLTTPNPEEDKDLQLFRKLGLNPQQTAVLAGDNEQQQRLEQALMTPDTDEYYNAAAL